MCFSYGLLFFLGISGIESADKSSLQDHDKQQISFFVIRFPMKYSDRLTVLDIPFLKHEGFGIRPDVTAAL